MKVIIPATFVILFIVSAAQSIIGTTVPKVTRALKN